MQAINFHNVGLAGIFHGISFMVQAGSLTALVSSNQDNCDSIVRLLLGLEQPSNGLVSVLQCNLASFDYEDLLALRRRIAVVYPSGGLVSNLKVLENVLLPLEYHGSLSGFELEECGIAMLRRVGYEGKAMELPGHLSLFDRRIVGQARAFIMEPELVIYNAVLGGLSEAEKKRIVNNALEFHQEKNGRTSLFLTSLPHLVRELPFDACLTVEEE